MARIAKGGYDWQLTIRVRQAARDGRVAVSSHAREKALEEGLQHEDIIDLLRGGIVRSLRERDEKRTAIDGYKHFLISTTPWGILFEVVFKFVPSQTHDGEEEVVVLITLYRGEV
ncbi:MAG: hypothetical protein HYY93_11295 [Planctomycetes bacterium]|nr:hypothetical protein [Planctomycetota bacterium]